MGISHKRFLGWEPVRTVVTDGDVQTVSVEPEWDDEQRDHMIALALYEDGLCAVCGGPPEDCQSLEAERLWEGVPPVRCHKTDAILRYQENGEERPRPRALMFGAKMRQ